MVVDLIINYYTQHSNSLIYNDFLFNLNSEKRIVTEKV